MTAGPSAPELHPIADAFAAAEAQARAQEEAERLHREEEAQRELDIQSIRNAHKRGGMKMAKAIGRTYGFTAAEVEAIFASPPASRSRPAEDDDDRDDDPPPPPGDAPDPDQPTFTRTPRPIKPLPDDCPVTALGVNGGNCFYLTPGRELMALDGHSADRIRALFAGRVDWLWGFHVNYNEKTGIQRGWKADRTAESLIDACGRRGVFDAGQQLRGVGAWRADDGQLVLHCGDGVYHDGEWRTPGYLGTHVYPGHAPVPRPSDDTASAASCASEVLALLKTWPWERDADAEDGAGDVDGSGVGLSELLVLGWVGCALVGGALDWRPMIWITGDAGSGKSTLQKLIQYLMGSSLVASSDATSAGIYQSVGYSSRAAAIDEAEADPNSAKMKNMIDLVRQSASGGVILRGSNDAKWKGFTARSAFLLSSIIIPPLSTQDLTRITILPLGRLTSVTPPKMDQGKLAEIGRRLRRRALDGWSRWPETLEAYRLALAHVGHDARGCDQYGALLAMADLMRFDEIADSDTISLLAAGLGRAKMQDRQDQPSNAEAMLNYLITKPLDVFRGGTRIVIGTLVAAACGIEQIDVSTPQGCVYALQAHGIFVEGFNDKAFVTLPNNHTGLADLFDKTVWGTSPGAATSGWSQAMRRLPQAEAVNSRKVGGRGWRVPVGVFLRHDEPK